MNKINHIKISRFFSLCEFECPCCKRVMLSPELLLKLEHLRGLIKKPIYINSGYRCSEYNQKVGGIKSSYHMLGMAADIHVQDIFLSYLLFFAQRVGFTGIGFYEKKNFLHLDVRPGSKRFWKGRELIGYWIFFKTNRK